MRHFLLASILIFLFISSCRKPAKETKWDDTISTGFVPVACDESFKNLIKAEVEVFEAHFPGAYLFPISTTEEEVVRLLLQDSVRLALTTRELNPKETAELIQKNRRVNSYIMGFDGVALIANPANKDSIIGLPTIKKILTGEITEWSQIYPDSHLGTIRCIFDSKESGVLYYAVQTLLEGKPPYSGLYALNSISEVIEKVTTMPNAIGLIGFGLLSDNTNSENLAILEKIRLMRVSKEENANLQNSYLPYEGDIKLENYPLWRPIYVLQTDPKSGLSTGFSIFLANEIGQKVLLKSGFLPIRDTYILDVLRTDGTEKNGTTQNNNKNPIK
jgi:phosphate transport system substrate-binding protein